MNYKELQNKYKQITELVLSKRLTEAFSVLDPLTDKCLNIDYRNRLQNYIETYRNMLTYSFELGDDPEKDKVYAHLVKSVLELNDEIREEIIKRFSLLSYYNLSGKNKYESALFFEEMETGFQELELMLESESSGNDPDEAEQKAEQFLQDMFRAIWLKDKLKDKEIVLLKRVQNSELLPWYYKSLIVSAITISCLRHFDSEKIQLLLEFFDQQQNQVWQRALTGLLLNLYFYQQRIFLYPEIISRLKVLQDNKELNTIIEATVIQLLRAKDTEKVSQKIKEEIMPEIWKMKSTIEDKLNIEELLSENMLEDKNPEWETVFQDSPDLYNKIEEFSNLQMEGADVFLSAFAMLNRYEFFNEISNWFLPFYKENILFQSVFNEMKEGFDPGEFLEGLERTRMLCNSDKYSFCLNVKHMPSMQKSMMVELFNMELNAMKELEQDDDLLHKDTRNRTIIVQYIQDLYRFFKLHPYKNETDDIFEQKLDFHNKDFFWYIVDDLNIIRNIGEFHFEKSHFKEALDIFLSLEEKNRSNELLEKAAYCYQSLGEFENALEYYKKSELMSDKRTWLLNKIAFCNRRLGNYREAISYYLESEKIDPENLYIQTSLGQVHMDMNEYENALKYFFKVEYLAPDNVKVHRPIAWCSFVLGKLETAKKYFEKIISKEGNQYDYMNLGHILWSQGKKTDAIESYKKSLKKANLDFGWFMKNMKEDSSLLMTQGISEFDIPLMLDYLRMNI